MLPNDTHIGRVRLQVSDLARSLSFYTGLLGLVVLSKAGGEAHLAAQPAGPVLLELVERRGAVRKPNRSTGLYHVAIRLPGRAALGRALQRLLEQRYMLQGGADHLVSEAVYLADPDGNGLELYCDRPRADWPMLGDTVQMASDPLDAAGLLQAAAEAPAAGETIAPQTDIGHIHLQVSDLAQAESFFGRLLGLEVTQRSYPGALFLAAGGYHHHVGTNVWSSRGAGPPPEEAVGLQFFELVIPGEDERAATLERLQASGIPVEPYGDRSLARSSDGIQVLI